MNFRCTILCAALMLAASFASFTARGEVAPRDRDAIPTFIEAVTVYPASAEVTRRAEISFEAGRHEMILSGFPADLLEGSVRLRFPGGAGLWLEDLRTERVYLTEPAHDRTRDLESRITAVRLLQAPADAEGPEEDGALTWKEALRSGEEKTGTIRYTVEFPQDLDVFGLE